MKKNLRFVLKWKFCEKFFSKRIMVPSNIKSVCINFRLKLQNDIKKFKSADKTLSSNKT